MQQTGHFKICPKCQSPSPVHASFCQNCGHGFSSQPSQNQGYTPSPQQQGYAPQYQGNSPQVDHGAKYLVLAWTLAASLCSFFCAWAIHGILWDSLDLFADSEAKWTAPFDLSVGLTIAGLTAIALVGCFVKLSRIQGTLSQNVKIWCTVSAVIAVGIPYMSVALSGILEPDSVNTKSSLIDKGMTSAQVYDILGKPLQTEVTYHPDGRTFEEWQYSYVDGDLFVYLNLPGDTVADSFIELD